MNNPITEKSIVNVSFLNEVKQFYLVFPQIFATPWRILSWSHYKRIMQVPSEAARNWYLKEASEQYLLCLPTKEELRKEIETQKELFALQQADKK